MTDVDEVDPARTAPRRIAFVITRSDAIGGAQVHVYELARVLRDAGHEVAVFVGGDGPFADMLRAAGVQVFGMRRLVREIRPVTDMLSLVELRRALARFRPDLVSCHSTKAGWSGRVVAAVLRVPAIVTVHGQHFTPQPLVPWQRAIWVVEFATALMAERIIVVSHYDGEMFRRHGVVRPDKLAVVHNALPDVGRDLHADPERDPPRVVMTARLELPKDPMTVVAAFARLRDRAWTLELIGDGPLRGDVERAVHEAGLDDRVELLGTRDDVPERLARAQIFLLSSRREGFPISILEAMRAGLPVVASDVGGVSEAVADGVTGAVVAPGSADALAEGLAPLLSGAALRRKRGAAGRASFLEGFAYDRHVRRIWAVYVQAMRGRRRSDD